MLIFDVVMTPTMSRNIFGVIWKFWKNSIFWVILESLLQLKRILDHFKSWNYPILCVWWVTKSFELIKVPEVCFLGGGLLEHRPMSNAPKKSLCQIGLIAIYNRWSSNKGKDLTLKVCKEIIKSCLLHFSHDLKWSRKSPWYCESCWVWHLICQL